ncbi:MBL fold metallo-hydrolase [Chitinimonas sp.]|uniref:MBL fold metallo-hydrolase n=1 Tax=Chitinimonas sp. TaxID=1934313 RepID=UPI0035B2A55B
MTPTDPTSADLSRPSIRLASGRFRNGRPRAASGLLKTLQIAWRFAFHKPANTVPAEPIALEPISADQLLAAPDNSVVRLGHSTVLLKLCGGLWLTDPVFSERASPLQWLGPRRFHAPPISIAALPPITGVILSHDHYDHLDHASIMALVDKVQYFVTPLGVGDRLIQWGVPAAKVLQLDWWEETRLAGVRLVATPAQHFSGRGMLDTDATLWSSWVIETDACRVFFSGDSGYFDGFRHIGERHGPFDLTLMETGAYDAQWPDVHMQPHETVQAHLDLRGKQLLPIHNGTFDLAMHAWDEPFERIASLAAERGVALSTPRIGELVTIGKPPVSRLWWRETAPLISALAT